MQFKMWSFQLKHKHFPDKQGILLEKEGRFSEVSPLPGWSHETVDEALDQLYALLRGWQGQLLPSVEFGLYGLSCPPVNAIPCALLLSGTPQEVLNRARLPYGCLVAKLKVGHWSVEEAARVITALPFKLRIDFNRRWTKKEVYSLCSKLNPEQIEFLEDARCTVPGFQHTSDSSSVWKPMVQGLPPPSQPLILSSSLESSIGLHQIASLMYSHKIPRHILGLGTILDLEKDTVQNSARLENGMLHFPPSWRLC